ncbi:MAG: hypothetical protein AB7K24_01780 [Gemmataceae bacterium]
MTTATEQTLADQIGQVLAHLDKVERGKQTTLPTWALTEWDSTRATITTVLEEASLAIIERERNAYVDDRGRFVMFRIDLGEIKTDYTFLPQLEGSTLWLAVRRGSVPLIRINLADASVGWLRTWIVKQLLELVTQRR